MITLDQINAEIESVIAHGNNRSDVEFLANLYICAAGMQGKGIEVYPVIEADGESEFMHLINGRRLTDVLPLFDELIEAVKALNPRLYQSFISRL